MEEQERANVVVAGAGIAGLEFAMALADIAGRRARITVVAPEGHFVLKPLVVREPFGGPGLERHQLRPVLERIGAEQVLDAVTRVDTERKTVTLRGARSLPYDVLAVCIGGLARPAYTAALTFWSTSAGMPVDDLLARADASPSKTLAIVIPPATTWPLPAYELALMLRRRAEQLQLEPKIVVLTPESTPLSIFGEDASAAVAGRLAARHVEVEPDVQVGESGGELLRDDGSPVAAGAAIALPRIDGPSIPGLPSERDGFVPIDEHCRVIGCDDVYAAGDGTSFPIKQGGIASQQADAAAEHLAYTMGVRIEPQPFRPVLRGELLTGADSIKMLHTINDGEEGLVSPDYLWWPRLKVGGRYLSAWLAGTAPRSDLQPREMPIEVEASWPHDWHGEPI
jgi:sulfide:quinone oxidoreductase